MGSKSKDIAINHLNTQINRCGPYSIIDRSWVMTTADLISRYFGPHSHQYQVFFGWQESIRVNFESEIERDRYFELKRVEVIRMLNDCIMHIERFGVARERKGAIIPALKDSQTLSIIVVVLLAVIGFVYNFGAIVERLRITREDVKKDYKIDSMARLSRSIATSIDTTKKKPQSQHHKGVSNKVKR